MENNRVSATSIHEIYCVDLLWGDINAGNKFCISQAAVYKLSARQTRQSAALSTHLHLGGHLARSISNLSNFLGWVMAGVAGYVIAHIDHPAHVYLIFSLIFIVFIRHNLASHERYETDWNIEPCRPFFHRRASSEDRIPFDGRFLSWKFIFTSVL